MKKLLYIFQIILKFSLIFLISFIWLRFLLKPLWLSLVLSIALTIVLELIFHLFAKKTKIKNDLKISEKENADNMFLSLLTNENYLDFFAELVKSRHKNIVKKKDYIIINHLDNTKVVLFPYIKLQNFSLNDIITLTNALKKEYVNKLVILCNDYDKNVTPFFRNFDYQITILDRYECYRDLYKEYDFFPEITMKYKKEAKLNFKDLLAYSFNRSRTKGYIFASIILFITSFFVKLNIYYCIVSTLLLLFALISFINPKYNYKSSNELI